MRIHWVYPHRRENRTPYSIGWHVADALAAKYPTYVYDWAEPVKIVPQEDDVLIGHPHPAPRTVLRRSWNDPRWKRRLLVSPYSASLHRMAFMDRLVRTADRYLAITGVTWFESIPFGPLAHWKPKMTQLDLAVDTVAYAPLNRSFNPPGERRFLYIGNTDASKNPRYLEEIRRHVREANFGWAGAGEALAGFERHGYVAFDSSEGRELLKKYDFLVMAGRFDANPTTVIEAMSWGIVPVATATAGYDERDGVVPIPGYDPGAAGTILREWSMAPSSVLEQRRQQNWQRVRERFTWERFLTEIEQEVSADRGTEVIEVDRSERALLFAAVASSPLTWNRSSLKAAIRGTTSSRRWQRDSWKS